jgi:hypothetical protein
MAEKERRKKKTWTKNKTDNVVCVGGGERAFFFCSTLMTGRADEPAVPQAMLEVMMRGVHGLSSSTLSAHMHA